MTVKKILLMGLDNSGKSTILLSLKQNSNLLSFLSLKPTKGLSIEDLGKNSEFSMSIWDFGGQEQYRNDYLKDFRRYSARVDNLIFVIDVQAFDRYEKSLKYLEEIIKLLSMDEIIVNISIFIHKYDPKLALQEKFKDLEKIVKEKLVDKINEIIPLEYNFEIYKTTIYTVFEKNLINKRINQKK